MASTTEPKNIHNNYINKKTGYRPKTEKNRSKGFAAKINKEHLQFLHKLVDHGVCLSASEGARMAVLLLVKDVYDGTTYNFFVDPPLVDDFHKKSRKPLCIKLAVNFFEFMTSITPEIFAILRIDNQNFSALVRASIQHLMNVLDEKLQ